MSVCTVEVKVSSEGSHQWGVLNMGEMVIVWQLEVNRSWLYENQPDDGEQSACLCLLVDELIIVNYIFVSLQIYCSELSWHTEEAWSHHYNQAFRNLHTAR